MGNGIEGIEKSKKTISVIMQSYLQPYHGSASNREEKFKRAVNSFIANTYEHKELIIVSDGCEITNHLAVEFTSRHPDMIKLISLPKLNTCLDRAQTTYGMMHSSGDRICYLDADDFIANSHLSDIAHQFTDDLDWVSFPDFIVKNELLEHTQRNIIFTHGHIGTSCFSHRRNVRAKWNSGYSCDWDYLKQLMVLHDRQKRIEVMGYMVCHIPNHTDF